MILGRPDHWDCTHSGEYVYIKKPRFAPDSGSIFGLNHAYIFTGAGKHTDAGTDGDWTAVPCLCFWYDFRQLLDACDLGLRHAPRWLENVGGKVVYGVLLVRPALHQRDDPAVRRCGGRTGCLLAFK